MCEKNKKKKIEKKILFCFLMILGLFLLGRISIIYAIAEPPSFWGGGPNDVAETTCGGIGSPKAVGIGCRCNYDYYDEAKKTTVHITCAGNVDNTFLSCSTNDYNTSGVSVCLVRENSPCTDKNPDIIKEASCEASTVCKVDKCQLDTGGDIFAGGGLGTEVTDIRDTIRTFINIALGFLGVLCVVFIIYGGVLWLTSSGKSDQVKKGQDTMIWAALGAIIITIAWTITSYVLHIGEVVG